MSKFPFPFTQAINSLRPGAIYNVGGLNRPDPYSRLVWKDLVQTKPTEQEINDEIARLAAVETTEDARVASIADDPRVVNMKEQLKAASVAQLNAWCDGQINFTTVAQARDQVREMYKRLAALEALVITKLGL